MKLVFYLLWNKEIKKWAASCKPNNKITTFAKEQAMYQNKTDGELPSDLVALYVNWIPLLQDSVCMMINYSQLHFSYADIKSWQCLITSLFNYCYMIECMFTNTTSKYLLFTNWSEWKSTLLTCPTERMYIIAKKATRNLNVQAGEFLHNISKSIK